ncbi:hypothetical protein [Janibacter sp. Soil728]|uniref:hypothetical protein n=1 Tax=Janibacter sp. Soil728 TaxID=1736393 RepID=UPI0012E9242E|nr:hypothetical protein [Janibacter sp. Soil728]
MITVLIALFLLAGCGSGGNQPAQKSVDERGMRTDLDPLTRRFPAIGDPASAHWQSGTYGDDRVPGPSTRWIDAVVELDPEVANRLRLDTGPPTGTRPDLVPDIDAQVPDLRLAPVTGFGHGDGVATGWSVQGWLVEGSDTLVLSAQGQ